MNRDAAYSHSLLFSEIQSQNHGKSKTGKVETLTSLHTDAQTGMSINCTHIAEDL